MGDFKSWILYIPNIVGLTTTLSIPADIRDIIPKWVRLKSFNTYINNGSNNQSMFQEINVNLPIPQISITDNITFPAPAAIPRGTSFLAFSTASISAQNSTYDTLLPSPWVAIDNFLSQTMTITFTNPPGWTQGGGNANAALLFEFYNGDKHPKL